MCINHFCKNTGVEGNTVSIANAGSRNRLFCDACAVPDTANHGLACARASKWGVTGKPNSHGVQIRVTLHTNGVSAHTLKVRGELLKEANPTAGAAHGHSWFEFTGGSTGFVSSIRGNVSFGKQLAEQGHLIDCDRFTVSMRRHNGGWVNHDFDVKHYATYPLAFSVVAAVKEMARTLYGVKFRADERKYL